MTTTYIIVVYYHVATTWQSMVYYHMILLTSLWYTAMWPLLTPLCILSCDYYLTICGMLSCNYYLHHCGILLCNYYLLMWVYYHVITVICYILYYDNCLPICESVLKINFTSTSQGCVLACYFFFSIFSRPYQIMLPAFKDKQTIWHKNFSYFLNSHFTKFSLITTLSSQLKQKVQAVLHWSHFKKTYIKIHEK